jgi:hypothetical protein
VTEEAQRLVAGRLRTTTGSARHRPARAANVNIAQLLGTVCADREAQVGVREDVASVNAERHQLPKNAAVGTERLRRRLRLP